MANLEVFETLFDKMDDGEKRKMITMLISEISVVPTSNIINRVKFHFNIESDDENNLELFEKLINMVIVERPQRRYKKVNVNISYKFSK